MNEDTSLKNEPNKIEQIDEAPVAQLTENQPDWYIVQTYSGHEKKVQANLEQRIKSMDMSNKIFQVVIPTQNEIEIRDGQKKTKTKNVLKDNLNP